MSAWVPASPTTISRGLVANAAMSMRNSYFPAATCSAYAPLMSVEVVVFSCVEELVAVTVAPGIGVLPDFTTPLIATVGVEGASCAIEVIVTSNRTAMSCSATRPALKAVDVERAGTDWPQPIMRVCAVQLREALIHSTLLPLPIG